MILYALASRHVQETVELFASREEAEAAVRSVIVHEPALAGMFSLPKSSWPIRT
jgi:hypothetical protein